MFELQCFYCAAFKFKQYRSVSVCDEFQDKHKSFTALAKM